MDDQNFEVTENNSWATPPMNLPKPPAPEPQQVPPPGLDPNFNPYLKPELQNRQGFQPQIPGQPPYQGHPPYPDPAPYYPAAVPGAKRDDPDMRVSDWLLTMLIMCIPVAGIIMLIVWASESRPAKPSRKTWAIAALIWTLISFVIGVALFALFLYLIYLYY